ncbi:hypothetical protein Tco_0187457 [Tanacetum coccineum]
MGNLMKVICLDTLPLVKPLEYTTKGPKGYLLGNLMKQYPCPEQHPLLESLSYAGESSFVYLGGKIPIDASTLPNADLPIYPNMPDLEDASDTLPNDGIFNGAYDDDEDVGAMADFNNMDNTIAISLIPILRIHKDHPKEQTLGDPTSAIQTRGKIQKASSV